MQAGRAAENCPPRRHLLRDLHLEIDCRNRPLRADAFFLLRTLAADGSFAASAIDVRAELPRCRLLRPYRAGTGAHTQHLRALREGSIGGDPTTLRTGRTHVVIENDLHTKGDDPPKTSRASRRPGLRDETKCRWTDSSRREGGRGPP